MAQVGLTLGARNIPAAARYVGYGVSYNCKLSDESKVEHDEDVCAASGIVWSMMGAALPVEVIQPITAILRAADIPHLGTRWVKPGELLLYTAGCII